MVFEPWSGFLRYVRLGDREVVRGVYAAVRDEQWGTLGLRLLSLEQTQKDGGFVVRWYSEASEGEPWLEWHSSLMGRADGTVEYSVRGIARRDFQTSRTGVVVLHPVKECAGQPCVLGHSDGSVESSFFPDQISPHQPFFDLQSIEHAVDEATRVRIEFVGEVFETEDQRNWTDASYKTYCRPLAWPRPYPVKTGEEVAHTVRISLLPAPETVPAEASNPYTVQIDHDARTTVPQIGLMLNPAQPLQDWQWEALGTMGLTHLGIKIDQSQPDWQETAAVAAQVAEGTGLPLQLFLRNVTDLQALKGLPLCEVVLQEVVDGPWDTGKVQAARAVFGDVPILAASTDNFTELNRNRPSAEGLDGVGFALNPQVHAFDDLSIMESTETHELVARDARRIHPGRVSVGPITFEPNSWRGRTPDARLNTPFGAAWTVASVKHLAAGGADRVTYFETHGPRGVLGEDPSQETLLHQLFKRLAPLSGAVCHRADCSHPLCAQALHTERGGFVANLTNQPLGEALRLAPYEIRQIPRPNHP
jgi:hypothetical protein